MTLINHMKNKLSIKFKFMCAKRFLKRKIQVICHSNERIHYLVYIFIAMQGFYHQDILKRKKQKKIKFVLLHKFYYNYYTQLQYSTFTLLQLSFFDQKGRLLPPQNQLKNNAPEHLMLKIKSKFAAILLKSPLQPLIYNRQTHLKLCNICCKVFKVCLTILERYTLQV